MNCATAVRFKKELVPTGGPRIATLHKITRDGESRGFCQIAGAATSVKWIFQLVGYVRIRSEFGQKEDAGVGAIETAVKFEPKDIFT